MDAPDTLWEDIFCTSFRTTRETKLQSLQFKLIYRVIPCAKRLYDWKLKENPNCKYCNECDDLRHFFLRCNVVEAFWKNFFNWWDNLGILKIILDEFIEESILFGFWSNLEAIKVLNYLILQAKFYIYRQRLFHENEIIFVHFLKIIKNKLEIEKFI